VMTVSVSLQSVCLSVCLSASISPKLHVRSSPIFVMHVTMSFVGSSSDGIAIRYVLPVLRMTSYLHIMGHMQGFPCKTGTASQLASLIMQPGG